MRLPSRRQIRQLEGVVANHPSGFFDLAAAPRQPLAATTLPTSPRKTRVGVFRHRSSGQTSSRRRCRSIITPGSRPCVYKTVSGRHEWPNQDPLGEAGGINLYQFVYNSPLNYIDPDGKNPLLLLFLAGAAFGGAMTPYVANAPGPNDPTYPPADWSDIAGNALAGGVANVAIGGAGMLTDGALPKPKLCPVSRWGSPVKPGEDNWVMNGPVSLPNYVLSGKMQPSWFPTFGQPPNIPAPYSSGVTINVPPASLSWPSGPLGPLKGALGQRIYRP